MMDFLFSRMNNAFSPGRHYILISVFPKDNRINKKKIVIFSNPCKDEGTKTENETGKHYAKKNVKQSEKYVNKEK